MIGNDEVVATFARHRGVLPSASASLAVTSDSPIDISSTMLPTYSPSTGNRQRIGRVWFKCTTNNRFNSLHPTILKGGPPSVLGRIAGRDAPALAARVQLARLLRHNPSGVEAKVDVRALGIGDARHLAGRERDVPPHVSQERPRGSRAGDAVPWRPPLSLRGRGWLRWRWRRWQGRRGRRGKRPAFQRG